MQSLLLMSSLLPELSHQHPLMRVLPYVEFITPRRKVLLLKFKVTELHVGDQPRIFPPI